MIKGLYKIKGGVRRKAYGRFCKVCGAWFAADLANVKQNASYGTTCSRKCACRLGGLECHRRHDRRGSNNPRYIDGDWQSRKVEYKNRYRAKHPEAAQAHDVIKKAIRSGDMILGHCEVCGTENDIHAHHDDYSKPLDVRWLCQKHHIKLHTESRKA